MMALTIFFTKTINNTQNIPFLQKMWHAYIIFAYSNQTQ